MSKHYRLLSDTKQQYREIFQKAAQSLEAHLMGMRAQFQCTTCIDHSSLSFQEACQPLPANCDFRQWQTQCLQFLEQEVGRGIFEKLQQIEAYRDTFSCHMCGVCCRMASVDRPYHTLVEQAQNGDAFAQQFTSVFLPYASREAARKKAPEVVAAVLAEAGEQSETEEKIFFYHCPYVGEDNRCSIYGTDKRPQLCNRYPETPLSYVYENCAWRTWKDETHADTLLAHAMLAYSGDLRDKLQHALNHPG